MYKLCKNLENQEINGIQKGENTWIPISSTNSDYARFKKEINEETAQLQDADGNTMTSSEAKAFVATLP